ncbi:MAG: Dph6-related ATP pyrophosphatase [Dehalococcoidales bacterium]
MIQAFASWSGGKDCCLALYRAKKNGMNIRYLVNMVNADGQRSCSHGVRAAVVKQQAEALGIPIVQRRTDGDNYEAVFIETLKDLKRKGIDAGVFGDIDFEPHREWNEKVCVPAGITVHLPLWQESQPKLLEEFIGAGFKAVVITVKADLMGKEFLGRLLDKKLIADIAALNKDITPCGEAGEFHTLVLDGPIFQKRLEIIKSEIVSRGEHHFLEILKTDLKTKNERR